jgi:hypothetical protein
VAGNIDVGIYADDGDAKPGSLLVSAGLTAQSGTNSVQFDDCTDTALAAGRYWLALFGAVDAAMAFREVSVSALPSSATPTEVGTGDVGLWLFGFSTVTSP